MHDMAGNDKERRRANRFADLGALGEGAGGCVIPWRRRWPLATSELYQPWLAFLFSSLLTASCFAQYLIVPTLQLFRLCEDQRGPSRIIASFDISCEFGLFPPSSYSNPIPGGAEA